MALTHEHIVRLFVDRYGERPSAIFEVAGDGSARSYYRLVGSGGETAIGAVGPDREENRAFLSYSRAFRAEGLPVPEIYGADDEGGVWLEEDLGDTTLFDALSEARGHQGQSFPPSVLNAYLRVVELLPRFQIDGHRVVDYSVAYPRAAFDSQSIRWDLNYFKYHFLKLGHVPFNEGRLETDFDRLTEFLLQADTEHFLYRDFQSRNVMLRGGAPWFIDYQGGRRGALHYDVASLLYDAKADIPEEVRRQLLGHYLDALEERVPVDRAAFEDLYRGYVLVRIMQAMGAYGYRGFFERKARFLQSVPFAAKNIERILAVGLPVALPELARVFGRIVERWAHRPGDVDAPAGLAVRVGSFSYKRGYPEDEGGHGGGFVFDCRALPNPGRYLEYRSLTGLDRAVVDFIEGDDQAEAFWDSVSALVDRQIEEYLRRGFTSLAVSFGCTGGQHRSPYFAERLRRHITANFPDVKAIVIHREEPYWPRPARDARVPEGEPAGSPASGVP
jgi:aminoglycoside/choline kinase family phosphotransferase